MLKLQDVLSFEDIIGRSYHTAELITVLFDGDSVYAVAGEPDLIFVRITHPSPPLIQAIRLMLRRKIADDGMDRVLWPYLECRWPEHNDFCGFLAKRIVGLDSMLPLSDWIAAQNAQQLPIRDRVPVGRSLLHSIRQTYRGTDGYVSGQFSTENFAVDPQNRVFFVDSWHCGNLTCNHAGKAAPEQLAGMTSSTRYHQLQDSFQFGMLLFEVLTGIPAFGGHAPQTVFPPRQIEDMIADGESVFFYEYVPECDSLLERLEQEAPGETALLRRTLDYSDWENYTQFRPDMKEWFAELLESNKYT